MLTDLDKIPGVQLGDFLLQFELDEPRDSVREIARKELRETPEIVLTFYYYSITEDKDLSVPMDSEAWLVRFLRPCKFYPESAYDLIKRYYGFKLKHSKHYDGLIPSKETNVFIQNVLTVLPTRDQYGRRVLVLELGSEYP
ncbi:hypothetical protein HF086_010385 [Spodoptera exigua]|uniref:CRAL/TRIO N-terminal domain-containing protein n=1 Tax=Spodoptera exigua TaxID=7107 RepID=A0A922MTW8_SPOEX|nr:hypothetical protein HF086_010385 [Spodoptera exigua]